MDNNARQQYDEFNNLIERHKALIDWLCSRHTLGDENRSAELRQDCYISLWHYLPTLRKGASHFQEKAWVAWHCRSVFSHLNYRRRTHQLLPIDENMTDSIREPDNSNLQDTIDSLASQLTAHERSAFYLMAQGYSAEDISKELGIKHHSAVVLRHRIIEKLKKNANVKL